MKQIIQSLRTGETILEDIPVPQVTRGNILIKTSKTLVSLGTERMLVEFGKSNLIAKARQQPEKVKQVFEKIKTDGFVATAQSVLNRLEEPLPLGYCNVGRVVSVGDDVSEFHVGDRVASNGYHAEYVSVPKNLAARIPDNVTDEEATFTVIGSIALQGMRLINPTFGETIVVIGLGLIGLLTTQLLIANGCKVIGIDIDEHKLDISRRWGVNTVDAGNGNPVTTVQSLTKNVGADGVIITASSKSNDIVSQAAQMSRKRGRLVLVGVTGLNLNRADFYEKELSFQVSCSYGPGRYDDRYEKGGIDYPLPYVRWTEKRNFETILQSLSSGLLKVKDLICQECEIHEFQKVYSDLGNKRNIASILTYGADIDDSPDFTVKINDNRYSDSKGVIGIIGAGNFTKLTMLPAIKGSGAQLKIIASASGITGTALAKKYKFSKSTTDYQEVLNDNDVDLVLITTRHNLHARMIVDALKAGKHVFVEKPMALNMQELESIKNAYNHSGRTLTAGFNRRFSPHARKVKSIIGRAPINVIATMNAGFIPPTSWVHDPNIGGGRIIGEACHFIDLITFLTGSRVTEVCMNAMGSNPSAYTDNATVMLRYENGSSGVINYFSNGAKTYAKERVEVYSEGRTAIIDNFRQTTGYGFQSFSKLKTSLDKGHKTQFTELIKSVQSGGGALIPFSELVNTTEASFAAIRSLQEKCWVPVS